MMCVVIEPKPITIKLTVDNPTTGYMRLRSSEPICLRRSLPYDFEAEQPRRFFTWAPFSHLDSSLLRSLVATLIGDGNTGVIRVRVYTSKSIGIFYDPKKRPPHLFKLDVKDILRDEDRHGWPVRIYRFYRQYW